ncbi:hypothetical protein [Bacillus benzoevorans]|uniref:DUF3139 domain-containing protein n=1 Tax=Bacillus benzoevorans TaxID=1456 RepID=A0A7X0LYX7_9BACI|nr:hypothetical protein [Bacillus benzoevorans]MBB6447987.1 hypothetical protein [Bacillus benzoevorans]
MKKIFIIICILLIIFFSIKVYFYTYENLANKRIAQVIELQGANNSEYEITFNSFDYKRWFWDKDIIFNNDKEIKYKYSFNRKDNIVEVFIGRVTLKSDATISYSKMAMVNPNCHFIFLQFS